MADYARRPQKEVERIDLLYVCCRTRAKFVAWCREEGVPAEGDHIVWVKDTSVLLGQSEMHYHALMSSPDWQELAAACYARGGRWVLGTEINAWSARVRAAKEASR